MRRHVSLGLTMAATLLAGLLAPAFVAPTATARPVIDVHETPTCVAEPRFAKHDFRAMWVATVVNIDWPSRPGLSIARQQAELRSLLDLAARRNFNAVVLQVRPTADTFWPSSYEPWSAWLTGRQGSDPGYDPLAFAVEEAHRRNLALHAWFNPYRVSMTARLKDLSSLHPARLHPDWVVRKDGRLYYNPGIPEVRAFVTDVIMEAVTRYDIDGVHFDDYFYPYPGSGAPFRDGAAYAAYGTGYPDRASWRRANVDALISGLHARIEAVKPWVQFGVSPFAVWRNDSTDPAGSDTRAGIETYDDLYADTRRWVHEGWIDYVAPQVYWPRGYSIADYDRIVPWWAEQVRIARANGHDVGLYIGEAAYRAGTRTDPRWRQRDVLASHRRFTSRIPEVSGAIYFSANDVRADRLGTISTMVRRWYSRPALLPTTGAGTAPGPSPVRDLRASGGTVSWTADDPAATAYAVYRVPDDRLDACTAIDARYLMATVRDSGDVAAWTDPRPDDAVTYLVTAVDRLGQESAPTVAAT